MPPLLIDLPQMIDLALGTPEIGVVNFTVLHSLLHAMTEVLNLDKYRVEFRGNQGMKVERLIQHLPIQRIVTIQEFKVDEVGDSGHKTVKRVPISKPKSDKYDKILVIRKTEEIDQEVGGPSAHDRRTVQQPIQIISQEDFRKLDPHGGASIHDPVGRYLPPNQEVLDSGRGESEDNRNPVGEMWYVLNVTKRVDATEVAIEKITSMMHDMSEEYRKIKNSMDRFSAMSDVSHLADKFDVLEKMVHDHFGKPPPGDKGMKPSKNMPPASTKDANVTGSKMQTPAPGHGPSGAGPSGAGPSGAGPSGAGPSGAGHGPSGTGQQMLERRSGGGVESLFLRDVDTEPSAQARPSTVEDVLDELYELKSDVDRMKGVIEQITLYPKTSDGGQSNISTSPAPPPNLAGPPQFLSGSNAKGSTDLRDVSRRIELLESKFHTIEHQIFDLEKELAELADRFDDEGQPSSNVKADITGIADVYAKVAAIKTDLDTTIDRCNFLIVERDHIVENVDAMLKKIEEFKNVKVDKDEIDELLAEKADYSMLQRKVSVDQFDATKRHLTNGLVEALDKLNEQAKVWDKAIEDVKAMAENKVSRDEIHPLRDYIDVKIHAVQERLKAMAALRRDPEAAGTKSKYLRQVNCISCDQDVIMRLEEPGGVPRAESIPPPNTLKPFLVYELDSIRKQMHDPTNRNLHHFEAMSRPQIMVDGKPKKLANRYCGGSHTILTPQDRVQRCKFSTKQLPAECFIKADEGCYYRAMKKECTCSGQKPEDPGLEKVKDTQSARSSKSDMRPVKDPASARISRSGLNIEKDPLSAKTSRNDVKTDEPQEAGANASKIVLPKSSSQRLSKIDILKQIASLKSSKSDIFRDTTAGSVKGSKQDITRKVSIASVVPDQNDETEEANLEAQQFLLDGHQENDVMAGGEPMIEEDKIETVSQKTRDDEHKKTVSIIISKDLEVDPGGDMQVVELKQVSNTIVTEEGGAEQIEEASPAALEETPEVGA